MSSEASSTAMEPGVWPPVWRTVPSIPKFSRLTVAVLHHDIGYEAFVRLMQDGGLERLPTQLVVQKVIGFLRL
jgi:hypothetical protein